MNDLVINVAAGLISSVLAPFVVTRLGGGTLPSTQQATIHGDHNNVTQNIDQSTTVFQSTLEVIYEQLPERRGDPEPISPRASGTTWGDDDMPAVIVATLMVAALLVLTYLFIWPIVVWAFVGAAIGIALMTVVTALMTRGTPGPWFTATLMMVVSSTVLLLAAWWTLDGGPGSEVSFARLESAVAERYPSFSRGLEERWRVTVSHPWEILTILGWRGFLYVLTEVGAVVFAALIVWARAREVSGWIALHNLTRKPTNRRLIERAVHFKELGAPDVLATLIAAAAICFVSSGWAHSWLEKAQEQQEESLFGSLRISSGRTITGLAGAEGDLWKTSSRCLGAEARPFA